VVVGTRRTPRLDHVTPVLVAGRLAEDRRMPVYVHAVDLPMRASWSTPA
jgi:hypothetical protein